MPATVQTLAALLVEKVNTVRPLVAVAVSVFGEAPKDTADAGAKITVWEAALMTTLALAEALLKLVFPAWAAVRAQLPAPTMVS